MKKAMSLLAGMILLAAMLAAPASAATTYFEYTYDAWGNSVPSQAGYEPRAAYTAGQLDASLKSFNSPQDLCVGDDDQVYVLDSGNGRVVCLNSDLSLKRIIDTFTYQGESVDIGKAAGIFVDGGLLYIAVPDKGQVIVCDGGGAVKRILTRPQTNMLDKDLEFLPQKVLVDGAGTTYVLVSGVYQGALMYDGDGVFQGFYGSNEVKVTAALLLDSLWKKLLSRSQADNISKYVPEEFTSFDIDGRDFVYTVTQSTEVTSQIKKLNPMGANILTSTKYGEQEQQYVNGEWAKSRFTDVAVDKDGRINVIDQQNNRIFQYDREGELLFVMGGTGNQVGTYGRPAAIDCLGDSLLVLDAAKGNLTVMETTAFGRMVHEASDYYNDGLYDEASDLWQEVLRLDQNYELAYVSIGKALLAKGDYENAAAYFKLGQDREGNSDAFKAYRNQTVQRYFPLVCVIVVLLTGLLIWLYNRPAKHREPSGRRIINPMRMLFHPYDTADEIKRKNGGSVGVALAILALWFVGTVFKYSLTNFRFNLNDGDSINIFLQFITTIPLFIVWVVSNWGVCALMDGKGRMKEIFITNAYCMIPFVISQFVYVAVSQFLVDDETIFLQWILILGVGWSVLMLLGALSAIHDYFAGQTVISVIVSAIGVLIVVFLVLLVFSLVQQAYAFVLSILNELLYRMR